MKGKWRDCGRRENSREQSTCPLHTERQLPASLREEFTNPESSKELLIDLRDVNVFQ